MTLRIALTKKQIRAMGPDGERSLLDRMPLWMRVIAAIGFVAFFGIITVCGINLINRAAESARDQSH